MDGKTLFYLFFGSVGFMATIITIVWRIFTVEKNQRTEDVKRLDNRLDKERTEQKEFNAKQDQYNKENIIRQEEDIKSLQQEIRCCVTFDALKEVMEGQEKLFCRELGHINKTIDCISKDIKELKTAEKNSKEHRIFYKEEIPEIKRLVQQLIDKKE